MTQDNILFLSATEIANKIRNKEVTSYEVVSTYLQQIEEQNGIFNAVVLIDKENALRQAKLADEAIKTVNNWTFYGVNRGMSHNITTMFTCTVPATPTNIACATYVMDTASSPITTWG